MSLLDQNFADAEEPTVVPADEEYKLNIMSVRQDTDKNGAPYFLPTFECVDHPTAKEFTKFYRIPHSDLNPKQLNKAKWAIKNLLLACGMDPSMPFDPEQDLVGKELWAILGVSDDEEYGEQNYVKKLITPK